MKKSYKYLAIAALQNPEILHMNDQQLFEEWLTKEYILGPYTLAKTPDSTYYSTVSNNTYKGRAHTEYSSVQMLWECWKAAHGTYCP